LNIWVDADACPVAIKEILFRAAERTRTQLTLVANRPLPIPRSKFIATILVDTGFDIADNEILLRLSPGDLVVTADIPLSAEVIEKGGVALNPRGTLYSRDNINARLNMRDFLDTLRSSGVDTGGTAPMGKGNRKEFADDLDRILAKRSS
jgi:uncharacterized protein YaiI (UPF0178 family)